MGVIKDQLSIVYHKTFGRFFECAKLYRTDINDFKPETRFEKVGVFSFFMPGENEMSLFNRLYDSNPIKMKIIETRVNSGDYLCFAYRDDSTGDIAYTRWLCKNSFYSDIMRKQLHFSEQEALTLDSYTPPDYRKLGLHRNMNIYMLQWLKEQTGIKCVYMVIKCFLPHLTKIPKKLGFRPIERVFYYKKGSLINIFKLLSIKIFSRA